MISYIKKDKDHDVLGYPINPKKLYLPEGLVDLIEIEGKKLYWFPAKAQLQCAKCLYVVPLLAEMDKEKGYKILYTTDSCNCNRI